jgi:hypothetical protein
VLPVLRLDADGRTSARVNRKGAAAMVGHIQDRVTSSSGMVRPGKRLSASPIRRRSIPRGILGGDLIQTGCSNGMPVGAALGQTVPAARSDDISADAAILRGLMRRRHSHAW